MLRNIIEQSLLAHWYANPCGFGNRVVNAALLPLDCIARFITRNKFKKRVLLGEQCEPPVVVIGNISVGGTGKTPIITWLAEVLIGKGYTVGIIARGHGTGQINPLEVVDGSLATEVGDEPLDVWQKLNTSMHCQTQRSLTPVFVGQKRNEARLALQARYAVDVILSDDGLQHYAMPRTAEIVLVDGARGFGNGYLLPRGPLREPLRRLKSVDCVLVNGAATPNVASQIRSFNPSMVGFSLNASYVEPLNTRSKEWFAESSSATKGPLTVAWGTKKSVVKQPDRKAENKEAVAASQQQGPNQSAGGDVAALFRQLHEEGRSLALVTGIGNPQRFFSLVVGSMEEQGYTVPVSAHPFPDHHPFKASDFSALALDSRAVVLMTDKDASKCREFAEDLDCEAFTLSVTPQFNDTAWLDIILERIGLLDKKLA